MITLNISIQINENATSNEINWALVSAARYAGISVVLGTVPEVDEERDVLNAPSAAVKAVFYRSK